jgi:hypothetical protein
MITAKNEMIQATNTPMYSTVSTRKCGSTNSHLMSGRKRV